MKIEVKYIKIEDTGEYIKFYRPLKINKSQNDTNTKVFFTIIKTMNKEIKKVFRIIKKKRVDFDLLLYVKNLEEYNKCQFYTNKLTNKEYNLLVEVFR